MKHIIATVAMMLCMSSAWSYETCSIQNTGLSEAVLQQLKLDCEKLRLDSLASEALAKQEKVAAKVVEAEKPLITPEKVSSWGAVADGFAKAVGGAARELGVSVNEFIKTPAGMVVMAVILWKMMGSAAVGITSLLIMYFAFKGICKRLWTKEYKTVEVQPRFLLGDPRTKQVPVYYSYTEVQEGIVFYTFGFLLLFLITAVVVLTTTL